jgi:putative flavoprotein involved in K+ transport
VSGLSRTTNGFRLGLGDRAIEADQVVVATGPYQKPRIPAFASDLDHTIVQLHAGEYRNPRQLKGGPVLVIGAGNSGAEIAIEAAQAGHTTWLAGRGTGQVPAAAYAFEGRIFWFWANAVLSVNTPIGRKARPHVIARGGPLIRLNMNDVVAAGVVRASRVCGVKAGSPVLEGNVTCDVQNVVWCTGFVQDFSWIEFPVLDPQGQPLHDRGSAAMPGLYFIGLPFLSKLASAFIGGVGGDAERIVAAIASTARQPMTMKSELERAVLDKRPTRKSPSSSRAPSTPLPPPGNGSTL